MKVLALSLLAVSAFGLGGCVGYSTWPPVEGSDTGFAEINYVPGGTVVGEAVAMVALRYPPGANLARGEFYEGPVAVSLPKGASAETYAIVAKRVGPNCEPATTRNVETPTYYVTRVFVRNTVAEVDVLAPAPRFGETGQQRYQRVTVYLAGGTRPWRVTTHRAYPVGLFDLPARNEVPEWGGGPSSEN